MNLYSPRSQEKSSFDSLQFKIFLAKHAPMQAPYSVHNALLTVLVNGELQFSKEMHANTSKHNHSKWQTCSTVVFVTYQNLWPRRLLSLSRGVRGVRGVCCPLMRPLVGVSSITNKVWCFVQLVDAESRSVLNVMSRLLGSGDKLNQQLSRKERRKKQVI